MLQPSVPAWFEIPVAGIDRAQRFYEALLGMSMKRQRYMGDTDQAVFPHGGRDHASGALVRADAQREPAQITDDSATWETNRIMHITRTE